MPPKCNECARVAVEAILDFRGKNGTARKYHRCPECLKYLGPIPNEERLVRKENTNSFLFE